MKQIKATYEVGVDESSAYVTVYTDNSILIETSTGVGVEGNALFENGEIIESSGWVSQEKPHFKFISKGK